MTGSPPLRRSPSLKLLLSNLDRCASEPERILFLDLETTGLSYYYDDITLIGWSMRGQNKNVIRGQDIQPFKQDAEGAAVLVTFNGTRFDKKFLSRDFPDIQLPDLHIDLMYVCRRLGLKGGQKSIEDQLGLRVREHVAYVDGAQAVILWHQYIRGDVKALRELILYNRADIAAMGAILDIVFSRLQTQLHPFQTRTNFTKWSAPGGWKTIDIDIRPPEPRLSKKHTYCELFSSKLAAKQRIVGIDLSGSQNRRTGWCLLEGERAYTESLGSDRDIIQKTSEAEPVLVSIDSPLCLPRGRRTAYEDDPGRDTYGIMRECERELKRRGVNVYPCLINSMQNLTDRGMRLATALRSAGVPVIESYPGAAQDIIRIPRKGAGVHLLKLGLNEFGIVPHVEWDSLNHDELDAITAALVGTYHLANMTEALGGLDEPPLIVPTREGQTKPLVIGVSGPIAAGKTTMAHELTKMGYTYTRFSLVIDELLKCRGEIPSRKSRQELGLTLNTGGKQRWLCERTLERVADAERIVVDGLRFPTDYAYLFETYGNHFLHLHVTACEATRRSRYNTKEGSGEFDAASAAVVEEKVHVLENLAHRLFENEGRKSRLRQYVEKQLLVTKP